MRVSARIRSNLPVFLNIQLVRLKSFLFIWKMLNVGGVLLTEPRRQLTRLLGLNVWELGLWDLVLNFWEISSELTLASLRKHCDFFALEFFLITRTFLLAFLSLHWATRFPTSFQLQRNFSFEVTFDLVESPFEIAKLLVHILCELLHLLNRTFSASDGIAASRIVELETDTPLIVGRNGREHLFLWLECFFEVPVAIEGNLILRVDVEEGAFHSDVVFSLVVFLHNFKPRFVEPYVEREVLSFRLRLFNAAWALKSSLIVDDYLAGVIPLTMLPRGENILHLDITELSIIWILPFTPSHWNLHGFVKALEFRGVEETVCVVAHNSLAQLWKLTTLLNCWNCLVLSTWCIQTCISWRVVLNCVFRELLREGIVVSTTDRSF